MRHGLKWEKSEVEDLMSELKESKSWTEIAELHKRSEKSVKGKARSLFMSLKKDKSVDDVAEDTEIDVKIINEILKDDSLEFKKKDGDASQSQTELLMEMVHLQNRMVELMEAFAEKEHIKVSRRVTLNALPKKQKESPKEAEADDYEPDSEYEEEN